MKYANISKELAKIIEILTGLKYIAAGEFSCFSKRIEGILMFVGNAFGLRKEDEKLVACILSESEIMKIERIADCDSYLRFVAYERLMGIYNESEDLSNVVDIIKEAFLCLNEGGINNEVRVSRFFAQEKLVNACNKGSVKAMICAALLHKFKLIDSSSDEICIELLRGAGQWNNIEALKLLSKIREQSNSRVEAVKLNIIADALDAFHSGITFESNLLANNDLEKELSIRYELENAFKNDEIKKGTFNQKIAKVIYSDRLSFDDTRKVLMMGNATKWEEISKIIGTQTVRFGICTAEFPFEKRAKEAQVINGYLAERHAGIRNKPLLICCEEVLVKKYIQNYIRARLNKIPQLVIDGTSASITQLDRSEHDKNIVSNFIISKETLEFALILDNVDNISGECKKHFAEFVSDKNKYYISSLGVSIDMSQIIPIAFCSSLQDVDSSFKELCEVIKFGKLSREETASLLDKQIAEYNSTFNISASFDVDSKALIQKSLEYNINKIDMALKNIYRELMINSVKNIQIQDEMILRHISEKKKNTIGFENGGAV